MIGAKGSAKDNKEILMNVYDKQMMYQINKLELSVGKAHEWYMFKS